MSTQVTPQAAIVAEPSPAPAPVVIEAPAAAPVVAPVEAPAQPAETSALPQVALIESLNMENIEAALNWGDLGPVVPVAPVSTPPPQPKEPVQPAGVNPQILETTIQPAAPVADPGKVLPNRISTAQFDHIEQEAIALRKSMTDQGNPISLRQALERVEGKYNPQAPAPAITSVPPQSPAPTVTQPRQPTSREVLAAEVEALELRKAEHGETYGLTSPEVAKLEMELTRKVARLEALEIFETQAAQAQFAKDEQAMEAVKNQVLQEYPTAGDDKSYLGARCAAILADIYAAPEGTHPLRGLVEGTNAARNLVEYAAKEIAPQIAAQFGIPEAQALASLRSGVTATPPPAPAIPGARPVPRNALVTMSGQQVAPPPPAAPSMGQLIHTALLNPSGIDSALGFDVAGWG